MTDSEWLREFDERNKDVTEDDVKQASMWFTLTITADERLLLTSGLTRQAAAAPQTTGRVPRPRQPTLGSAALRDV